MYLRLITSYSGSLIRLLSVQRSLKNAIAVPKWYARQVLMKMCLENGHPSIVEYYELTEAMRDAKNAKGEPAYNFGVILNYLFEIGHLEKIANNELPLHIVEKKIPYLDEQGNLQKPEDVNGYKFESLILDLIRLFDNCLPFEVERNKEFAPIKNKTGVDSIDSARELLKENGITL